MRKRAVLLFVCLMGMTAEGFAQTLEALHMDRGCIYYQPTADVIAPIGTLIDGVPSWFFSAGATFSSGSVDNPRLAGPAFPGGYPMETYYYEGVEYDFEMPFNTEAELKAFAPAGDYVFSGTGSGIGAFTETVTMAGYAPVVPKRITNLDSLQSIDPEAPFTIEWEPFSDIGENMGFIEVDIMATFDWGWEEVWESPEDEGSFGLDTSSTFVEVPAGALAGIAKRTFEVAVTFTRIDSFIPETVFGSGLKAYVTSSETIARIKLAPPQGHVDLEPQSWCDDDCYGWMYGVTGEWGYSHDLGYIWVGYTPGYLYQNKLGWLALGGGTMKTGCWFFCYGFGWMYTHEGLGGWYATLDGSWYNMIDP